jgi:two-component system chemotaxis response regulator CheY
MQTAVETKLRTGAGIDAAGGRAPSKASDPGAARSASYSTGSPADGQRLLDGKPVSRVGHRRVLIVDDFRMMRKILRDLLRQIGLVDVDEAADGASAIEKLIEGDFDLVVSDWEMGPVSGLELLRDLRAHPRFTSLPFIMITCHAAPEMIHAAKDAGVSNYIVKPFSADTLRQKIDIVMGSPA